MLVGRFKKGLSFEGSVDSLCAVWLQEPELENYPYNLQLLLLKLKAHICNCNSALFEMHEELPKVTRAYF